MHSLKLAAVHVPYATLHNATEGFSSVPYAQGGHKLGEGGSGQVFHCRLSLVGGEGEHEVAVKVFSETKDQKVSDHFMSSLHIKLHPLCSLTHVYTVRTKSSSWLRYRPSQCGCNQWPSIVLALLISLHRLSHAHLVPVLGFSCDGPQQCLLYPYHQRGSLDRHISEGGTLTTPRYTSSLVLPGMDSVVLQETGSGLSGLQCPGIPTCRV